MISLCSWPPPNRQSHIRCMGDGSRPKKFVTIAPRLQKEKKEDVKTVFIPHLHKITSFQDEVCSHFLPRKLLQSSSHLLGISYDDLLSRTAFLPCESLGLKDFSTVQAVVWDLLLFPLYPACFIWDFELMSSDVLIPQQPLILWKAFLQRHGQQGEKCKWFMRAAQSCYQMLFGDFMGDWEKEIAYKMHQSNVMDSLMELRTVANLSLSKSNSQGLLRPCSCRTQHMFESIDDAIDIESARYNSLESLKMFWGVNNGLRSNFTVPSFAERIRFCTNTIDCQRTVERLAAFDAVDCSTYNELSEYDPLLIMKEDLFQGLLPSGVSKSTTTGGIDNAEIYLVDPSLTSHSISDTTSTVSICNVVQHDLNKITARSERQFRRCCLDLRIEASHNLVGNAIEKLLEISASKQSIPIKFTDDQINLGGGSIKSVYWNADFSNQLRLDRTTKLSLIRTARNSSCLHGLILAAENMPSSPNKSVLTEIPDEWSLDIINKLAQPMQAETELKKRPFPSSSGVLHRSPAAIISMEIPMLFDHVGTKWQQNSIDFNDAQDGPPKKLPRVNQSPPCQNVIPHLVQDSFPTFKSPHEDHPRTVPSIDLSNIRDRYVPSVVKSITAPDAIYKNIVGPMDKFVERSSPPAKFSPVISSSVHEIKTPEPTQVELVPSQRSIGSKTTSVVVANTSTKQSILSGLKILVAERFFEEHAVAIAELFSSHEVISMDAYIFDPVDIIVSCECGIVVLPESTLRKQDKLVSKIKSLLKLTLKFSRLWVIVMTETSKGDPSKSLERLNIEKCKLSNAVSRCGSTVVLRDCRASCGSALAVVLSEICMKEYRIFSSIISPDPLILQRSIERPYLDLLQDSAFLAHCDFLQRFPTLNLFVCAMIVSQWSLRELLSLTAKDVVAHLSKIYSFGPPNDYFQQCISKFFELIHRQK